MRFLYRKYVAWFLLALISVFIVPKELIHAFHTHTETHEKQHPQGETQFDSPHSHCYLLQLEAPLYLKEESAAKVFILVKHYCFITRRYDETVEILTSSRFVRGPPALFSIA